MTRFYFVIFGGWNSPAACSNAYTSNFTDFMDFMRMRKKGLLYALQPEDVLNGAMCTNTVGEVRGCSYVDVQDESEFFEVMESATGLRFGSDNYIQRACGTPICCYTDNELNDSCFSGCGRMSAYRDSIWTQIFILSDTICILKTLLRFGFYEMMPEQVVARIKTFIRRVIQYLIIAHESMDTGSEIEWFIDQWDDIAMVDVINIYDSYPDGILNDAVLIMEFLSASVLEPLPFDEQDIIDDWQYEQCLFNWLQRR